MVHVRDAHLVKTLYFYLIFNASLSVLLVHILKIKSAFLAYPHAIHAHQSLNVLHALFHSTSTLKIKFVYWVNSVLPAHILMIKQEYASPVTKHALLALDLEKINASHATMLLDILNLLLKLVPAFQLYAWKALSFI